MSAAKQEEMEWFLERASRVRSSPQLDQQRAEALEVAARLRDLLDGARDNAALRPGLDALLALPSRGRWTPRLGEWLNAWASADEPSLRRALLVFVDAGKRSPEERFDDFVKIAEEARDAHDLDWRPLIVLGFGSMLNFALDPETLPVIRRNFPVLERALGYDPMSGAPLGEQYENHLAFAHHLRAEMLGASVPVRDMIDVEACASLSLQEDTPNVPRLPETGAIEMLRDRESGMTVGERAAVEGILAQLKPALSLEIGAGLGGTLRRLASYSDEVHEIDLADPPAAVKELGNVHWHAGDSHVLLPGLLDEFSRAGRNVDFVLVDGDHSADGVRRDMEDLLNSPAIGNTIILAHDTMNESVRQGLEEVEYEQFPKVAYVELDFVTGGMFREPLLRYQLWGGLGLIVVDAAASEPVVRQDRFYDAHALMRETKQRLIGREASAPIPRSATREGKP